MKYLPKFSFVVAVFASAFILATPVVAAKKAEISGELSGPIVVDSSGFESLPGTVPSYGDKVRFLASVNGGLSRKSFVYITVVCSQGSRVVYQWSSRELDFEFPLADQSGQGLEWTEGTGADCSGTLIYREEQGRKVTIIFLDEELFRVAGTSS